MYFAGKSLHNCVNNNNNTAMQPNRQYEKLLQEAGIPVDTMANHLEKMGFGPAQQWRYAITTGDASRFPQQTRNNAMTYLKNNPQLVQQLKQVLNGAA